MLGFSETGGQLQGISFDFSVGENPGLLRVAGPVESVLGYSAESLDAGEVEFFDRVHKDDEDVVRELLYRGPTDGPQSVHLRVRNAEDHVTIFDVHYERVEEGAGYRLKMILFQATEVSEPVDDSTILYYFDELMKNSRDVVYIKNTHHVITAASQSLLEYCDSAASVEELVGRTDYEIHPEAQADHYHSLEKRVFNENRYLTDVQEAVTADGRTRWIDNRKMPLRDANGEVIGVFGYVKDVTSEILLERELKRSERRNRLFFDLVSSLHVIVDLNGRFIDVNNGWSELLGHEREEVVGNYIPDFLHPDDAARTFKEIERLSRGVTTLHFKNRYRHKSGQYRLIDWSAEYDPAEQLIYAAGNDITDLEATRERLEDLVRIRTQELENAQREAVEASLAKSQFLANMSHEIRTPMNGMMGMLNLLKKTKLGGQQQEYVDKAQYSAQILLEIINDILDLSKIESGEVELVHRRFSLEDLLENTLNVIGSAAVDKNIRLKTSLGPDLPGFVQGDLLRLSQVLINLLSNAVKFSERGEKVTVRVQKESEEPDGYHVKFSVQDRGIGISEADQQRIFAPFNQVDDSNTRAFGGTGLGLTICRQLIAMMDGTLWLESTEGEGSTFHFVVRLGRAADDMPENVRPEQTGQAASDPLSVLRGASVLLVEDDLINQQVARELLVREELEVEVAGNGSEALEVLSRKSFDLILMDCQMPVMDGYEATREIRANPALKDIPVLALTANAMKHDITKALDAGMDDHVAKPIIPPVMFKTMAKWLTRRHESA